MKLFKLFVLILFFTSCNHNGNDINDSKISDLDTIAITDTSYSPVKTKDESYEIVNTNEYYIWEVNSDKKTLKKNPMLHDTKPVLDSVISGMNHQYESILLEKISFSNDTLYLKIPDADYLTNQIGSSGAAQYIAQAVINLTSVPGVKYVHIDFAEGSHVGPDTWSRKDFPGYIIIQ